jgi:hypothetical protein
LNSPLIAPRIVEPSAQLFYFSQWPRLERWRFRRPAPAPKGARTTAIRAVAVSPLVKIQADLAAASAAAAEVVVAEVVVDATVAAAMATPTMAAVVAAIAIKAT